MYYYSDADDDSCYSSDCSIEHAWSGMSRSFPRRETGGGRPYEMDDMPRRSARNDGGDDESDDSDYIRTLDRIEARRREVLGRRAEMRHKTIPPRRRHVGAPTTALTMVLASALALIAAPSPVLITLGTDLYHVVGETWPVWIVSRTARAQALGEEMIRLRQTHVEAVDLVDVITAVVLQPVMVQPNIVQSDVAAVIVVVVTVAVAVAVAVAAAVVVPREVLIKDFQLGVE
ncbi:MAG: hypothetical protein M1815_001473 [Lichina confinis]|nr:MAG: hypothetical protein M1815_001473 [Lichina confinis]